MSNRMKASQTLEAIRYTFEAIGLIEETRFQDLTSKEEEAHEYIVAKTLHRIATKRLEIAEKMAIKAGVIGNPDLLVKGEEVTVWRPRKTPPSVIITAKMSNDRIPMIDRLLLAQTLRKHFSPEITDQLIQKSSKAVEPSVTYSVVLFR